MTGAVPYDLPVRWVRYDQMRIFEPLVEAKSAVLALTTTPYQRSWVESLQAMQLKMEVAGTSRIEGADFTDTELEDAMVGAPEQLLTRSQRQAHAAVNTYRWIADLPPDQPVTGDLICEVHRRIVTGADDDRCEPGKLRRSDVNVTFGIPRHRGADGGDACRIAFDRLAEALRTEFRSHDSLVQALALHYHFAAMHPFLDGNGRTARALEALLLQRAGLRDTAFIAMSNYYYEEKALYLASLSAVRASGYDLTPFLVFGLRGIAVQCRRLAAEIRTHVLKAVYRNLMNDLFGRLESTRKRVIARRQLGILEMLLNAGEMPWREITSQTDAAYRALKNGFRARVRDMNGLIHLGAIGLRKDENERFYFKVRLDWPSEITETEFFRRIEKMPKAKTHQFFG